MQFSTLVIATLAAVASASPAVRRQAECPEVDNIPVCGVGSSHRVSHQVDKQILK
jgi:fructoselysine-6-P-deglycase FrlB-like protein